VRRQIVVLCVGWLIGLIWANVDHVDNKYE
jgi:hypothetical protein